MLIRLVIRAPFLCVGGLVMAIMIDLKLSIIFMIVIPLFILVLFLVMFKAVPLYKSVQKKLDSLTLVLRENLSGVRVIRAFAGVKREKERFNDRNTDYANTAIRVGKIAALTNPLTTIIMNLDGYCGYLFRRYSCKYRSSSQVKLLRLSTTLRKF